ncbi:MAG: FtsK/SpoIIIE domain-containing protein [Phycisphaerae bacterium]
MQPLTQASPSAPTTTHAEASPRQVQREALRDLLSLASQCAATESEIEQHYQQAIATAKETLQKQKEALAWRFRSQSEAAKADYTRELAGITADYDQRCARLKQSRDEAVAKIKWEFNASEKDNRQKIQEAKWLAEGDFEAAQIKVREQAAALAEDLKKHSKAAGAVEQSAAQILNHCGVKPAGNPVEGSGLPPDQSAQDIMNAQLAAAESQLANLRGLALPKIVFGVLPWTFLIILCAGAAVAAQLAAGSNKLDPRIIAIVGGITLVVTFVLLMLLRMLAKRQLLRSYEPLRSALAASRTAAITWNDESLRQQKEFYAAARKTCEAELQKLSDKAAAVLQSNKQKRDEQMAKVQAEYDRKLADIEAQRAAALQTLEQSASAAKTALDKKRCADDQNVQGQYDNAIASATATRQSAMTRLEQRLRDGLTHTQGQAMSSAGGTSAAIAGEKASAATASPGVQTWRPAETFPAMLPFGEMRINLKQIVDAANASGPVKLQFPAEFATPAALSFPYGASLLVQHERSGRERAISLLQAVMLRILTDLPPGRARFTMIDPVGLGQSFAGFMRLADHDDALVGGRIWTQPDQIEQRLADMTEHMETVIQKYLRNEFATIDDYNAQAGELAEPYRFVVIADFPAGFSTDTYRRLASIAATGSRCGVYLLIAGELQPPAGAAGIFKDIAAHAVQIVQEEDGFRWKDEVFGQFPLQVASPPPEEVLTPLLDKLGQAAKASQQVEVDFDTIAPNESEFWTSDSAADLTVPIGRMGATRLQLLRFGKGVAQHALIAGKTGSGKSTLLHAIVCNLVMWYSPSQVELYLIDFKKGVEFKTYASHKLPHARAIAVESDREFGLSVLERLDAELARRGELFRAAGVPDLPSYRRAEPSQTMPRVLLTIDEFQEFFSEDDTLAQQAGLLLDRLVRQGRAFGIHLLLGSQTIGGTSGLARSTIGQMAVRIALQVSEADSQLILGDNNSAARLLSRPGAAIYNDAGGLVEANSPFQVAWLPDEKRDVYLDKVRAKANAVAGAATAPAVVFEGNAPADPAGNQNLIAALSAAPTSAPPSVRAWIGEPVAIKEPTAITLRRQSGANVLLVGQQEEQALSVMAWSLISLAVQYPQGAAEFYVFDGSPADSYLLGTFEKVKSALNSPMNLVEWRSTGDVITELAADVARRLESPEASAVDRFIIIYGLQRYRMLRKSEDDFSFSSGGEEKKADPAKDLVSLLRDGPAVGVHVLAWVDTLASQERTFERGTMREFDYRILFQMSAADSSSLIDSPAANKLGFYRALACSEEQGGTEKFRPYFLPDAHWRTRLLQK